ncbi:MAG: hypothetical protein CHACPFDD_03910 [Phycisphaerae bacterium]|nr:hypothetical protein [Phycisphaerae bacterium]
MSDSNTVIAHLAWALADGIGPILFRRIVERFGDAERALGASALHLAEIKGVGRDRAERIMSSLALERAGQELEKSTAAGLRIVTPADAEFPEGLRKIPDPPIVLFVKGELRTTDALAIAVVGSRQCTIYGSEQARRFGELLAGAGFTVVSGLARGIDSFAQHGALDAGGRSIGVLGCGLDEVYPPENKSLADRVTACGALLSELPIGAAVQRGNFPPRNRIIAGMTLGTLVVEAAHRSGALITARLASEYNRELFAVPGRVQDPMSMGANALIRDGGAKLVTCLEDILDALGEVGTALRRGHVEQPPSAALPRSHPAKSQAAADPSATEPPRSPTSPRASPAARSRSTGDLFAPPPELPGLSPTEQRVLALLSDGPVLQDVVLSAAGLAAGDVLAAFTTLELKGLVRRLPGQMITRR